MADKKQPKPTETPEVDTRLEDLTADLQRTRADFENYRKRVDADRAQAVSSGKSSAILKLLPVVDNIERAIRYMPEELSDNAWAKSVQGLVSGLDKSLEALGLKRIIADAGTTFDPELHQAISFNEDAEGDHEIIEEELQAGYMLDERPIRHAMVRVTRN